MERDDIAAVSPRIRLGPARRLGRRAGCAKRNAAVRRAGSRCVVNRRVHRRRAAMFGSRGCRRRYEAEKDRSGNHDLQHDEYTGLVAIVLLRQ